MRTAVKWVAELAHVREVSLLGTADPGFWRDRLRREDLLPAEGDDGRAQLLVVAAEAKFRGIRFRELSFSVRVRALEVGAGRDAAFMVRAFNSCRFLAACERLVFATPYQHGDIHVSAAVPATLRLDRKGVPVFGAGMRATSGRSPTRVGEAGWDGPVFLPRKPGRRAKVFFARLSGLTRTYQFLPAEDSLTLPPSGDDELFRALRGSNFAPVEWALRDEAVHAKSATYDRETLASRLAASAGTRVVRGT